MKIYLATWLTDPTHGESLTKIDKRERLLSYYYLMNHKGLNMRRYVRTGRQKK